MADSLRWRWLQAVAESDLPSTTRLVCHTLALHMNRLGANCYPGIGTICDEAGLGRTAVCRHLASLEELGWLRRERDRRPSGAWGRTTYLPAIPAGHVVREEDDVSAHVVREENDHADIGGDVVPLTRGGRSSDAPPRRSPRERETVETDSETEELPSSADPDPNWVARAVDDVWKPRTGGVFSYGRMGNALKPLVDEHGADLVLEALDHYLCRHADEGRLDYATPEGLAQKFGAELRLMEDGDFAARSQDLFARADR